ncbi:hypothetical protein [Sporosarcina sp. FSL W7-1283]|uniref:hypothetical protein n=1 Tax=Sporosarcina sp. FSL W7-1283 TaxID=2921560 RepID=UPI0030FB6D11
MFDYQFIIRKFNGEKEFYMQRFDKELNDEEISEVMVSLYEKYSNVKSTMLDRVFIVK